jgi:CRP-like cAMP-binding protein
MNCREDCDQATLPAECAGQDPEIWNIVQLLAGTPLFSSLSTDNLCRVARGCKTAHFQRGNVLFRKGDPCHGFYLTIEGQIKLAFISADGNQKVVEIIRAGQSFGEAVMFMGKPYMLMAEALTEATVLHIGKEAVFGELAHDPGFCAKLIGGLSQRLHHLISDLEAYSLCSGRERIIGYLLREEERDGTPTLSGPVTVRLPTQKGTIASRLNLTQEHFSRILHDLIGDGLLTVKGRCIHIPDIGRLRASLP